MQASQDDDLVQLGEIEDGVREAAKQVPAHAPFDNGAD